MQNVFNQLPELIAFVESVENSSFSAAARSLGTTPSAISKRITKLENRLGIRLLQRTTRSLSLTAEGSIYYERIARLLQELNEVNDLVVSGGKPCGTLTITTSFNFGQNFLVQLMPQFLAQYPEVQVDLRLSDRFVDLAAEGIDVAIRFGELEDSSLIRRHLGTSQFVLCASPRYLQTHGTPTTPADLSRHNCMRYVFQGQPLDWEFWVEGGWQFMPVSGSFSSDNSEALKAAAIAGIGIARLLDFQITHELETHQLVALLPTQVLPSLTLQALFTHKRNLSPRVQVFLEFITTCCTRV